MGITGTTAKEASTTIEGSVSSMSSAWDNWVAGMADSEANFSQLTSNLVDSIVTVVGNIAPRVIENSAEAGKRTGRNRRAACNVYTTGYTGVITAFNERRTGLA